MHAMLDADPITTLLGASHDVQMSPVQMFERCALGTGLTRNVSLPVARPPNATEDDLIGGDFLNGRQIWAAPASGQLFFTESSGQRYRKARCST
jgi:hypothetical protein